MSKVERKLVFAVIGILASEPIVWLAQVAIPYLAGKTTNLLLNNEFISRLAHASEFTELTVAIIAAFVLVAPPMMGVYLLAAFIVGKGSLTDGNRWLKKHATFAPGGSGNDFAAWLLGLGAGLLLESPDVLHISRFSAWLLLATSLTLTLLARLSWGWLVRWNRRIHHRKQRGTHSVTNHEEEKRKWEMGQCQLVAAEMNRRHGTDYEAHPSNAEPADVILKSQSGGAHPPLPVQVVSIPLDFRHRDDKHSVEKIKTTLAELLLARGVRHCLVGIILSGEAEMHGIQHSALEILNEMILKAVAAGGNQTLRYDEIYEKSPDLATLVHDIFISHHEIIPGVEIDIPAGSAIPRDGRWIAEGVLKKTIKYGGANAVKGLTLVIGVAGFVDDEQIQAFQGTCRPEALPFSQIWIVTPFHGVVCLKA